jgi:hypothetical protein
VKNVTKLQVSTAEHVVLGFMIDSSKHVATDIYITGLLHAPDYNLPAFMSVA